MPADKLKNGDFLWIRATFVNSVHRAKAPLQIVRYIHHLIGMVNSCEIFIDIAHYFRKNFTFICCYMLISIKEVKILTTIFIKHMNYTVASSINYMNAKMSFNASSLSHVYLL